MLGYSVTNDSDDIYFTFNFTGQFPNYCYPAANNYSNGAGTAVEAHYIAIDSVSFWTTNTHVEYSIDGAQTGSASREPINQADYFYNQTLFRISGLEDTRHTLKVELRKPSVLLVSVPYWLR
jgi:hypothetical protein